ncbi:MAG: 16S rRNA (cytosine(967)-C(5))-methyltransferase RsmB [Dorea sp.]|nr:16S rRNA (cytosine(967)-C(5))-methyltransferase RsmB [Dorea sp.]
MSSVMNERELVLETLLMITRDGEYSHIALKKVLDQYQYIDKKKRSFITRVVNGTLEHMIEIDYIINLYSKVKVNKMKPVIRTLMRSGVYQLKYMDSVPDSAVCNETVKIAEKRGFRNLKGFVNGVLRNISRNLESVELPADPLQAMSVKYSMPEWILKQWRKVYDEATVVGILEDFLKEKPVCVRADYDKISKEDLLNVLAAEGVMVTEEPELAEALYLSDYDFLAGLPSFQSGFYQVQDVSSMHVARWAAPEKDQYVIDVCAAPGGKAIHMAELLGGTGHVEARDLTDYKVGLIWENIFRSGLTNIEGKVQDATIYDPDSKEIADVVIADLPCSGLGVIGKKPDLKYRMTEEDEKSLAKLQREILDVTADYVKKGGRLLYSTCTIDRMENEDNSRWFLENHPEFELIKEKQRIPGIDAGDGFYLALFKKMN